MSLVLCIHNFVTLCDIAIFWRKKNDSIKPLTFGRNSIVDLVNVTQKSAYKDLNVINVKCNINKRHRKIDNYL